MSARVSSFVTVNRASLASRSRVNSGPQSKPDDPVPSRASQTDIVEISSAAREAAAGVETGPNAPGYAPKSHIVARGGVALPSIGQAYSASIGVDLIDAGRGVKHNQMRVATVEEIEAAGGHVEPCPERTAAGNVHGRHVHVIEPSRTVLGELIQNPAPKLDRIV